MPRHKPGKNERKLNARQKVSGIARVAAITYKASPLAVFVKLAGTLITSILPIVTTYFAALTTTPQEVAYTGIPGAGVYDIVYKLQVGQKQVAGDYQAAISYIITPIY